MDREKNMKKHKPKEIEKIDLVHYGVFRTGLTNDEIKEYLKNRANVTKIGTLWNWFLKIAGINTMAVEHCPECKKEFVLMYRHDVQRFADVLFLNKPTYWD